MQDKPELIFRSILVILFILFMAILYGYSENGRYTHFHNEIIDKEGMLGHKISVVDTRTGTIYQHNFINFFPNGKIVNTFYKVKLTTGKFFMADAGGKYDEIKEERNDKQSSK